MNYKKIITAILLVSDGPVDHIYFVDNFNISKTELINFYNEINLDLKNNDFLMVKGSNSTGLFNYLSKLKKKNNHAL